MQSTRGDERRKRLRIKLRPGSNGRIAGAELVAKEAILLVRKARVHSTRMARSWMSRPHTKSWKSMGTSVPWSTRMLSGVRSPWMR